MISGGTPETAVDTIDARGVKPFAKANSSEQTSNEAAPSVSGEL